MENSDILDFGSKSHYKIRMLWISFCEISALFG